MCFLILPAQTTHSHNAARDAEFDRQRQQVEKRDPSAFSFFLFLFNSTVYLVNSILKVWCYDEFFFLDDFTGNPIFKAIVSFLVTYRAPFQNQG